MAVLPRMMLRRLGPLQRRRLVPRVNAIVQPRDRAPVPQAIERAYDRRDRRDDLRDFANGHSLNTRAIRARTATRSAARGPTTRRGTANACGNATPRTAGTNATAQRKQSRHPAN